MKKIIIVFTLSVLCSVGFSQQKNPTSFPVIPKPYSIITGKGTITWNTNARLIAATDDEKYVSSLADSFLKDKGFTTVTGSKPTAAGNQIIFSTIHDASLGNEGYKLVIAKNGITIQANTGAGLFYGLQSFIQLMPSSSGGKTTFSFVEITDQPRFTWRGLHLDVSRHFYDVAFIKKYIDLMSHYKLNTFHWHLTDDQGWRIEIKKYPKLQELAAYRKETVIGRASTKTIATSKYDGKPYGGFYTQEEVRDVVAYASKRYVTIVPEIEMPGHAQAALTAYPELGCTGGSYQVATTWGVFTDVFCAGKENTFIFLQDVIDEIVPLFPGKFIHIGGDECPKDKWKACPYCQKRIADGHLKDEHALQSYFIQRMEKYINAKGKSIIGWDEILEGGLAPNAAVMSWRGEGGGIAAAQQNHDVVMTPSKWLYFDYYQDTAKTEPLAIGGYVPINTVYNYEPLPTQLTEQQAKHILGVQANVWTEYMPASDQVEYMVYPRAIALAEVAWTTKANKDYDDFLSRLRDNEVLLKSWHVNYSKHIFIIDK